MKAAVIEKQGGVENIVYRDWEDPTPADDEVIVSVRACGLNHLDIFVRRGMPGFPVPMPFISGGDISGVIEEIGASVSDWKVGDRVTMNPQTDGGMVGEELIGGLAEKVCIPGKNLVPLPVNVSFETGAAVPINYGTAHRMLFTRGKLKKGEVILVLGASGGVGLASVQFAQMIGAKVIAAAGTDEKCDRLSELGADHVINYQVEDFSKAAWLASDKKGCDVIVNFTGGDTWAPSLRAAKQRGRVLTCGATAGHDAQTDLRYLWVRELDVLGSNSYSQEDIVRSVDFVANGQLAPIVSDIFPLKDLAKAETLMENRGFFGKIVIKP